MSNVYRWTGRIAKDSIWVHSNNELRLIVLGSDRTPPYDDIGFLFYISGGWSIEDTAWEKVDPFEVFVIKTLSEEKDKCQQSLA